MIRFFLLILSLLLINDSYAQLRILSDNVIAIKKDASFEDLEGKMYLGVIKNGKCKYKKVKEINRELFDYAFMYYEGNFDIQYLFPLSSGKFDGKRPPFDVIKIITKKHYTEFKNWRDIAFIVDNEKDFPDVFWRYGGQSYGTSGYYSKKGYVMVDKERRTRKGIYYRYFYDSHSYSHDETNNIIKTPENEKDIELAKKLVGYEIIFNHDKEQFGIIDISNGRKYWGKEAVAYLDKRYLSSSVRKEEAEIAIAKAKADREAAYPCGWAYFSGNGKGNIKGTLQCTVEKQKAVIVFSGYNKNDNVIDEVFVLPPSNGKVEKDPNVIPPKVQMMRSYFQQGVNFYYFDVRENGQSYELYTDDKNVLNEVNRILNKSQGKWKNKSGVKYYHRDRWGESHLM